jgi:uncharacterized membrane protein (DUF2068 family)
MEKSCLTEGLAAVTGAIYLPIWINHLVIHASIINIPVFSTNVVVVVYMMYRLSW